MPEINWNLLDPNAPARVAQSFDLSGAWNQGQQNALAMQGTRQTQQMNALQMQKAQRIEQEAPGVQARLQQEAAQKQQTAGIDQELKLHTIRKQAADTVFNAPLGMTVQVAKQEALRVAALTGNDPAQALAHIDAVVLQGGEPALKRESQMASVESDKKLSDIQLVNVGQTTEFTERNPLAPGYTGQPIQMTPTPGQIAGAGGGGGTPYFNPVQTAQGIMSFNARTGTMEPAQVAGQNIIGSKSDPALMGALEEAKKTGAGMGETNLAQYQAAEKAPNQIKDLDRLLTNLNESEAITGLGAETFKNLERVKAMLGSKAAAEKVEDTELLDTMMGAAVFPMISTLGIGARGMDTPAEREFMRSVLTGSISLNKETLIKMTNIRKKLEQRALDKWDKRVKKGELDRFFEATGIPKPGEERQAQVSPPQQVVEAFSYGKRGDGTEKGPGFLGELPNKSGGISTELSVGVNIDGKEVLIPSIVPGLSKTQLNTLLSLKPGQLPPKDIINIAVKHAKERQAQGLSPFKEDVQPESGGMEYPQPLPPTISGDDDPIFINLPSGAEFIGPDGSHRRKL